MTEQVEKWKTTTRVLTDELKAAGWAPGGYVVVCDDCGDRHVADKRASVCVDCADLRIAANPKPPTEQQDIVERLRDDRWYVRFQIARADAIKWQQRAEAAEAVVEVARLISKHPSPTIYKARLTVAIAAADKAIDTETRSTTPTPDNLNPGDVHDGETIK